MQGIFKHVGGSLGEQHAVAGPTAESRMWVSLSKALPATSLPSKERPASGQGESQVCKSALGIQGLGSAGGTTWKAGFNSSSSALQSMNQLALLTYHRDKH